MRKLVIPICPSFKRRSNGIEIYIECTEYSKFNTVTTSLNHYNNYCAKDFKECEVFKKNENK